MACVFIYDPKNELTEELGRSIQSGNEVKLFKYSRSLQDLKYTILTSENETLNYPSDLIFFDSKITQKEATIKIIEEADKKSASFTSSKSVSNILKENLNKTKPDNWDDFKEWTANFSSEYGTAMHECIQAYCEDKKFGTHNFSKKYQELLKVLEEATKNLETKKLNNPHLLENVDQWILEVLNPIINPVENLDTYIANIGEEISKYINNRWFKFEVSFTSDTNIEPINGRMDLILVDDYGNIEIVDLKTSHKEKSDIWKQQYYLAQLSFYKEILSKFGIKKSKINFSNVRIATGTSFTGLNYPRISDISSPLTIVNHTSNWSLKRQEVRTLLAKYFPQTNEGRTVDETREVVKEIKSARSVLFNEDYLNPDDIERIKNIVTTIKETKTFISGLYGRCKIKRVGNALHLITSRETFVEPNIDEFCKKEALARIDQLEGIYDVFTDSLETFTNSGDVKQLVLELSGIPQDQIKFLRLFLKYGNGLWEVIKDSVFRSLGIVVFKNLTNGAYDFIKLNQTKSQDTIYNFSIDKEKTQKLLGELIPERVLKNYKESELASSIGNIHILQTLLAIGLNKSVLPTNGDLIIGNVSVVSTLTGNSTLTLNLGEFLDQFKIIKLAKEKHKYNVSEYETFEKALNGLQTCRYLDFTTRLLDSVHGIFSRLHLDDQNLSLAVNPKKFAEAISRANNLQSTILEKINICKDLCEQIKEAFPTKFRNRDAGDDEVLHLYQLLQEVIGVYEGLASDKNFMVSKMGFSFDDSIRLAHKLLAHGDPDKFNGSGVMLTGLSLGLYTAAPYANPDDTVRRITQYCTYATTEIQKEAEDVVEDLNQATSNWLKTKESLGETLIWSRHNQYYKMLFEKDSDGQISKKFRLINPFISSSLTEADKLYIKHSIWNMYRIHASNEDVFTEDELKLSFDQLAKDLNLLNKFIKLVAENDEVRNIPIHTATNGRLMWLGLATLVTGDKEKRKAYWQKRLDKAKLWWDPRGLDEKQSKEMEERIEALETYNMFDIGEDERARLLEAGPEAYEWNLNFLVNEFAFAYVTVDVNRKVLEKVDRALWILNFVEDITGRDLSNLKDTIKAQIRVSLYNANNVEKDFKDLSIVTGLARSVLNIGLIALRPTLMAKELLVGRTKNHLYTSMGWFGDDMFTEADMLKAEALVFSEGIFKDKFLKISGQIKPGDRSKVEAINWLFRIANMDANVVAQRTIADRYGIMQLGLDTLYYTNIRPDWYNRCSIFIAKMIHDGTFDAYTLDPETNKLVYHIEKDPRFSTFWPNRNKTGMEKNELFLKEKAKYLFMMESFATNGIKNKDGKTLRYGQLGENYEPVSENNPPYYDPLPIAYIEEEINNLKEITGELYGYYNHEEKNAFLTGTYANLHMSFKTYLSGELKHWFAINNGKTSKGKISQATDIEGNLLYIKYDEFGNKEYVTEKTDAEGNYLQPYYIWQGTPSEGLLVSLGKSLHDIFSEEGRERLKDPKYKYQVVNAKICTFRLIFGALITYLLTQLLFGTEKEENPELYVAIQVGLKYANDLSFRNSVIGVIDDFNLVGYDYLKLIEEDTVNTLSLDDPSIRKVLYKNVSAFKDVPESFFA